MAVRLIGRLVVALGLLFLLTAAFGQNAPVEAPITFKMRRTDARLNAPVTFSADRVYLGELLEALSTKTGVVLSMDNTDRFSGTLIACDLNQAPLAEVMNALWSLLGSKDGLWEWKVDARQPQSRYLLRPTPDARLSADRLRRAMQRTFEAKADALMQMAFLSPEARKVGVERYAAAMGMEDPKSARAFLTACLDDENMWTSMRLFANQLSPNQRLRVLRGEMVDVPLRSLSPEDRRAATKLQDADDPGRAARERLQLQAPAETLRFQGTCYRNGAIPSSLSMMVGIGSEQQGWPLRGYLGLGTYGLSPGVFADWILPGDLRTRDLETHPMIEPVAFRSEAVWRRAPVQEQNFAQLAAANDVSFLAVVSENTRHDTPALLGKTPAQYFSDLWKMPKMMHKWREGILLIHYPEWFYEDETQVPFDIVKRLRVSLQNQDGLLSLDDVATPVMTLNAAQLSHLSEEFPFPGARILTMGQPPQPMASICAFYKRYPKTWSERGVPIDLKMQAYLQNSNLWPTLFEENESITTVRLRDLPDRFAGDVRHTYTVQLYTTKRAWIDIASFRLFVSHRKSAHNKLPTARRGESERCRRTTVFNARSFCIFPATVGEVLCPIRMRQCPARQCG